MNYGETLSFLYEALPMFHRVGEKAYKPDLGNIEQLLAGLGNPHLNLKSVHVAGTNGKGSTSHMLAAIFQASGFKTGLYTSPHLTDFRERIQLNGTLIPEAAVSKYVTHNLKLIELVKPSFFEMTVALAFDYFADQQTEICIIETGLGGRLDSTNIIVPLLSVITNVSYDHMDLLGNTLEEIATEKAGIIKPGVPVVVGEYHDDTAPIFERIAKEKRALLTFASKKFVHTSSTERLGFQEVKLEAVTGQQETFRLDLMGLYQVKNLQTVLVATNELQKMGFTLSGLHSGLAGVQRLTSFRGRWTILSHHPLIVCDTGHNEEGLREVVKQIKSKAFNQLHIVIGFVKDKALDPIVRLLPSDAVYYFCAANIPRALDVNQLEKIGLQNGLVGLSYHSASAAFKAAKEQASAEDMIFVGGSTFVVGEIINEFWSPRL